MFSSITGISTNSKKKKHHLYTNCYVMVLFLEQVRRMDRARASPGGGCRQWRAWIHGRGSSGCGPDRRCFGVALSSSMAVSVFCGSSKPSCDGVLVGLGFDGQSRRCPTVVEKGSRDLVVISVLLGALSVSREGQLSSVFLYGILVCGCVFVCFLNS